MKILVSTGSWNAALIVTKSLSQKGCQVYLLDSDPLCAGFFSKYCAGSFVTPQERDKSAYLDTVLKIISTEKFDLLIPISDRTTEYFSQERERIESHTRLFLPAQDLITLACLKDKTYRFMLDHEITIPKTYFPESIEDVEHLVKGISFPCIVKKPRGSGNNGNTYFSSSKGLVDHYRKLEEEDRWPVIQEFVEGDFYGFTAVVHEGEILDCFMYTTRQEYALNGPPPYGVSVIDEELFTICQRLIRLLKWNGAISFDFLKDKQRRFNFLEINPRLPGSLDFAYRLGVDFPAQYLDLALGKAKAGFQGFSYKPGVKFHFTLPSGIVYHLRNKRSFLKVLISIFLYPFEQSDLPWDDPKLFVWKLKHLWWFWREKKYLAHDFNNSTATSL
jgi:predicted ATP-grasp superfamily ATP-dependent carboligase